METSGHIDTGKRGEDIAVDYLIKNGYQILERNWRNHHQEIDIIARKGIDLAIVEVKTRMGNPVVDPYVAVNKTKQNLLVKAANAYIEKNDLDVETRFDVISIVMGKTVQIEHIENAFYPKVSR